MGKEPKNKPATREERLKVALKANLQRRKAQTRARKASDEAEGGKNGFDTDQGRS